MQTEAVGGMWGFFLSDEPVTDYASAKRSRGDRFRAFFQAMLDAGVYLPPSPFESCFVSTAHDDAAVDRTIAAFRQALSSAAASRA